MSCPSSCSHTMSKSSGQCVQIVMEEPLHLGLNATLPAESVLLPLPSATTERSLKGRSLLVEASSDAAVTLARPYAPRVSQAASMDHTLRTSVEASLDSSSKLICGSQAF